MQVDDEVERFRELWQRGFLTEGEFDVQRGALIEAFESEQLSSESLCAAELCELADSVDAQRLSRPLQARSSSRRVATAAPPLSANNTIPAAPWNAQ